MEIKHWVFLVVVFIVGYVVGVKVPGVGTKIIGSVPSVSP